MIGSLQWVDEIGNHAVVAQSILIRHADDIGYSTRHNSPEFFFFTRL
jgi:hypothetical protein